MPRAALTLALLGGLLAPLTAQAQKSIDPGMTQAQVVERLGEPTALRTSGTFTYLFYKNGCGKECGMDDIVLLENDAVVDAVFRSPERAYTGKSSSPRAIPADVAARTRPGARDVVAPGPEVIQSGSPRESAPPTEAAPAVDTAKAEKPKADKPAEKPTTETPTTEAPKEEKPKPTPTQPSASPTSGTIRIPLKTQPRAPKGSADSANSGAAGTKKPT
jgi:outer membrane biosynthesis protein TonB